MSVPIDVGAGVRLMMDNLVLGLYIRIASNNDFFKYFLCSHISFVSLSLPKLDMISIHPKLDGWKLVQKHW